MGTVMLGVFAVEEVYKFGKAGIEMLHELQGETAVLKGFWKDIENSQEKLFAHPHTQADAVRELE